jgi:hypothetical protein
MLAGALDGKPPIIQQMLDFQNQPDVFLGIETLTGGGALRTHFLEFSFPKSQDVGGNSRYFADFANAEIEFVRNFDRFGCFGVHGIDTGSFLSGWTIAAMGGLPSDGRLSPLFDRWLSHTATVYRIVIIPMMPLP